MRLILLHELGVDVPPLWFPLVWPLQYEKEGTYYSQCQLSILTV